MAGFFQGFGGMPGGGGPRGRGGAGGEEAKKKKEEDGKLYKDLGLEKNANANDIKKAFRTLAMKAHPDRGGDPDKFKEIQKAYEILSDPQKKELYDQYGMEGVEQGGDPNARGGGGDLFDILTGGMGGRRRDPNAKRRGEDVTFPLNVTLEDLYNGMSKKLRLTKNIICKDCEGKGGKAGADVQCKSCRGQGIVIKVRQIGPGMIQQMQTTCDACNGEGTTMAEKDKCKTCKGARVVKEKKTLEVFVTKGMRHGERIPFRGEADEAPNTIPGDVIVILQCKEHDTFKRDGMNLFMKKTISLREALCGFQFKVTHLDGRILKIKSDEGAVVTPGSFKKIADAGMPSVKNQFQTGALYIEFDVEFPKGSDIDKKTRQTIAKCLPGPDPMDVDAKAAPKNGAAANGFNGAEPEAPAVEEVVLADVNIEEERQKFAQQRAAERESHANAYDEDDDHGGGRGQQAGCRAQ